MLQNLHNLKHIRLGVLGASSPLRRVLSKWCSVCTFISPHFRLWNEQNGIEDKPHCQFWIFYRSFLVYCGVSWCSNTLFCSHCVSTLSWKVLGFLSDLPSNCLNCTRSISLCWKLTYAWSVNLDKVLKLLFLGHQQTPHWDWSKYELMSHLI